MTYGFNGLHALQSFSLCQAIFCLQSFSLLGKNVRGVFCLQAKELAEAQERMRWHEMMSRRNIDNSEALQARLHLFISPALLHTPALQAQQSIFTASTCRLVPSQYHAVHGSANTQSRRWLMPWPLKVQFLCRSGG